MMIEVFSDFRAPTIKYARIGADWVMFPGLQNGWAHRRPWHPSPAIAERMSQPENITTFYGQAWLAEDFYGIPRDLVATYTAAQIEAKMATSA